MSVFKCKMCGGTLKINDNETVATCEYCGTKQTLPKLDNEKLVNLYDRANHFRRNNEFDKAMSIYEQILNEDRMDSEAYWSLVLCRYGIEYVEDPVTHKRIPTVNRAQFTSIFDDDNYKSALKYADSYQQTIYEEEARVINEIQKGILAVSQKEEPFDVFICYKETDASGRRTPDSVLANDLYYQLTQEGFKVFFSKITLEDKLGTAYEPYIFAALNSAKVMVVLGTKPEYFNAVWVKNEWSRYLNIVKQSRGKKILIPAYKGMDPYDLPEEFSHLQAQDMSKLGFMQDLIRGIKKIVKSDEKTVVVKETVVTNGENASYSSLLKRAFIFLEDGDFDSAKQYAGKVLDLDPENAEAYVVKLLSDLKLNKEESLADSPLYFDQNNPNLVKAMRYASQERRLQLENYINQSKESSQKLFDIEGGVLKKYTDCDIGNIEIPDGVMVIGNHAFSGCKALTHIMIPDGVTTIGAYAFADCTYLNSITIPDGVTTIGECAFANCSSLSNVEIPKGVRTIGGSTFSGCSGLTSITIPDGVTTIGDLAFSNCEALTHITIPDGVTTIGNFAFSGCSGLTSITIPDGVTTIGRNAFANCSSLYNVKIPNSVRTIGTSAFACCSGLTSITIPDGVKVIGNEAFSGCNHLAHVKIPNSVAYVGERAFDADCTVQKNEDCCHTKSGCYIATCVYGSYDCPEVWTLRRFRDETLGSTWYGRLFIRAYYAISPMLVKWFGHTKWFKKLWKGKLDHMVARLQSNGVEDTPYNDKQW